ncbi:MAG: S28 family serine protease, partial [Flavobacteriales bacterium]
MAKINKGLISMCIGLVCTILIVPVGAQTNSESELQSFLFDLTDVRFESTYLPSSFNQAWELHIKQPLDHDHPEWGSFWQRVYVSHLDPSRPTVGYNRDYNYASELAESIGANQVVVEHRYYGASVPDSLDYSYLNIKQASADLHRIKSLLADYFYGPWLASGISKGGQTTIFYRYFFP